MSKRLNSEKLTGKMESAGLSQADIAKALEVSREAVSKWLKGISMPKPDKLLRLALLVDLGVSELLVRESTGKPVIAFRKKGSAKTTAVHIERAEQMGVLLRPLVEYLPFDEFVRPASLKNPTADYAYLQSLVSRIRNEVGVADDQPLDFHHLIKRFSDTQTVLVPVLWGKKGHHENALHIFLPDSTTTWIFLNLDVEVHDFKFWMAHELGHVLAPELRGEDAEDFADAFAGALLLPDLAASSAYQKATRHNDQGKQINAIKDIAEKFLISPYGVYKQANAYAVAHKLKPLNLEPAIYGASKNLSKAYHSVSESLFEGDTVKPQDLIRFAREQLGSPFFNALSDYLRASHKGPGFIQSVLDIPALDARELHDTLV